MGKLLKRGKAGNAVQYVTRTQALRRLQLHLSTFRRLCILKGIHPREPKKKTQGAQKTYYHVKDINYLAHDPLLGKFREQWTYDKKIKKARAKQNRDLAERLATRRPTYRIDHLVKERYPSFADALRDLDDPLTMVHLFATLPAESAHKIPAKAVQTSRRLALEFQAYVVRTHALRKAFISVKGFYFQAEVMGQAVTWLAPHQLAQVLPVDVDYRVMLTFLEFYTTLLQFVNFKLYHSLGVRYPPVLDPALEGAAQELAAIMQDLAAGGQQQQQQQQRDALTAPSTDAAPPAAPLVPQQQAGLEQQAEARQLAAAAPGGLDAAAAASDEEEELGGLEGSDDDGAMADEGPADSAAGAAAAGQRPAAPTQTFAQAKAAAQQQAAALAPQPAAVDADDDAAACERLFAGLVFFLGREVPREQLLAVIRAFGGTAAWHGEGSPLAEADESITHQVVDRPTQGHRFLAREYVQPQWVVDSANFRVLAPTGSYAPGQPPPPHLSPFAAAGEDDYVPDYLHTMRELQELARAMRKRSAGDMEAAAFLEQHGAAEQEEAAAAQQPAASAEQLYEQELLQELQADEAAAATAAAASAAVAPAQQEQAAPVQEQEPEEPDPAVMMTRKARGLHSAMLRGIRAKKQHVEKLKKRKTQLKAKAGS